MTFTVLITAAGGGLSAETHRLFRASSMHKVRTVAVDAADGPTPVAARVADAFHKVPFGGAPSYAAAICDVVAKERVDLVLPCSDEEALTLSAARGDLEQAGAQLACAGHDTLRLVSSKERCFEWLQQRGFAVPTWRLCTTADELQAAYAAFGSEFAAKPARGRGNRDVFVVSASHSAETRSISGREIHMPPKVFAEVYAARVVNLLPVLVTERLDGPCYDVDTLSWKGQVHRVVPRQRLNPEGMPFAGNIVRQIPELTEIATRIATELGLSWLYDFDVMTRPSDGAYAVIEVNPRPSGSVSAAVAAGVPLFDDLITLAKGGALDPQLPLASATIRPFTSLHMQR